MNKCQIFKNKCTKYDFQIQSQDMAKVNNIEKFISEIYINKFKVILIKIQASGI